MEKKLKIQMNGRSDEFGTPKEALDVLLPYLKKDWTIWECAWGKGSLAKHLEKEGFEVIGEPFKDFLNKDFGLDTRGFNCETPSGKGSGAWFQTAWFCWKIKLPNQLNFVEVARHSSQA